MNSIGECQASASGEPHGRRLLVVDDNRDAADTLAMLLSFLGYETQTAYNGQEALTLASSFCPDMVILDINMPVMDGYQAAKELRSHKEKPRMVLIALTAKGSENDKELAREAGFDFHVLKPVDGEALAGLVERALNDDDFPGQSAGPRGSSLRRR
jgi:CheY-like chemotaxis protein